MRHVHISRLHAIAKSRKPGYLETALKAGKLEGEMVVFDDNTYEAIRREFNPSNHTNVTIQGADLRRGLGDRIHAIAAPIGQAIHWPCLQRDANGNPTQNLKPGSPCARARALLNKLKT